MVVPASAVLRFIKTEAGGGVLLALMAVMALAMANGPFAASYFDFMKSVISVDLGVWRAEATVKDWVKDGLMAVFFFVIGLELKRELTVGELSDPKAIMLPLAGAIGGAIAPVAIYLALAGAIDPQGWPVPVATDIAFALAALAILAPGADGRVRIFLLTLAVIDDLMAIILIAVLFTDELNVLPLAAAIALLAAAALAAPFRRLPLWLYGLIALVTWGLARESGVHTSVMAVAAAMIVPARNGDQSLAPAMRLEKIIHPVSAYFVLPIFAFCAAGVSLGAFNLIDLASGVPLAIALALAVGKPLGVCLLVLITSRLAGAPLPFSLRHLTAVGCVCGIGFTMSLFIAALAYAGDPGGEDAARMGVMMGSLLALTLAACTLRAWSDGKRTSS